MPDFRLGGRPLADHPVVTDFHEKRRLLYGKGLEGARAAAASAFLAKGRLAEALEFLERTKDENSLNRVRSEAVRAGDAISLARACQILRVEPTPAEWRELAQNAERAERWFDAVNALEKAGDLEKSEALRVARCPDFKLFRPAGK